MNQEMPHKITPEHLKRQAYLYVRQSTLRQVLENTESTKRQYGLRERALALGWPLDRIVVIDSDLGQSGADSDRIGFQKLVAAVGLGDVGLWSGWRCRAWPGVRPTGIGCSRSALLPTPSSSMKTVSTTRRISTTAFCSASRAP